MYTFHKTSWKQGLRNEALLHRVEPKHPPKKKKKKKSATQKKYSDSNDAFVEACPGSDGESLSRSADAEWSSFSNR